MKKVLNIFIIILITLVISDNLNNNNDNEIYTNSINEDIEVSKLSGGSKVYSKYSITINDVQITHSSEIKNIKFYGYVDKTITISSGKVTTPTKSITYKSKEVCDVWFFNCRDVLEYNSSIKYSINGGSSKSLSSSMYKDKHVGTIINTSYYFKIKDTNPTIELGTKSLNISNYVSTGLGTSVSWNTSKVNFSKVGEYYIAVTGKSKKGNNSTTQSNAIKLKIVDTKKPTISGVPSSNTKNDVNISVSDLSSMNVEVTKDGLDYRKIDGGNQNIKFTDEGKYYIKVCDIYDNCSDTNFIIDKSPPTLELIGKTNYLDNLYYSNADNLVINFYDRFDEYNCTGTYKFNDYSSVSTLAYKNNLLISQEGIYEFEIKDKLGHIVKETIVIDRDLKDIDFIGNKINSNDEYNSFVKVLNNNRYCDYIEVFKYNYYGILEDSYNLDGCSFDITTSGKYKINVYGKTGKLYTHELIIDTKPPEIIGDNSLSIAAGIDIIPEFIDLVSTKDNKSISSNINLTYTDNFNYRELGVYEIIYEAVDEFGNITIKNIVINYIDNVKPEINNFTKKYIDVFSDQPDFIEGLFVRDNWCVENNEIEYLGTNINLDKVGKYEVKYEVKDCNGNIGETIIEVYVVDRESPEYHGLFKWYLAKSGVMPNYLKSIDFNDNYYNEEELNVESIVDVDLNVPGNYFIDITVTDPSNNSVDFYVEIVILDIVGRVLGNEIEEIEYNIDFDEKGALIYDNLNEITINDYSVIGEFNESVLGEYELDYVVNFGNTEIFIGTRKIKVIDVTAPVITGAKDIKIDLGNDVDLLKGINVSDEYDGDLLDDVEVISNVNFDEAGNYEVILKVVDSSGNLSYETFNVVVEGNDSMMFEIATGGTLGLLLIGILIYRKRG